MPDRSAELESIDVLTIRDWLDRGDAVREDREFAAEHIAEACHVALSTFEPSDLPEIDGRIIVYYCLSGRRTTDFAEELAAVAASARKACQMAGGIEAWKAVGLPTRLGSFVMPHPDRPHSAAVAPGA